jgi:integral membrane protein
LGGPGYIRRVRNLVTAYRSLAMIVGVLLTVLVFVAMPLKYFPADGTSLQVTGDHLTSIVGIAHGWIYMAYLVVSFALSRRVKWSAPFTVLVLLAGLIPIVIFWVEHRATQKLRADDHQAAGSLS